MKNYLVVYKQDDEGCDYTIGCGLKTSLWSAENIDELIIKIHNDLFGKDEHTIPQNYFNRRECERALQYVKIYEYSHEENISDKLQELIALDFAAMNSEEEKIKEAREKELYESLNKKYGKK